MDPVSFAASLASLALAYDGVSKIVRKLRGIRNAPASFQLFQQEFDDLKIYLDDVSALTGRYESLWKPPSTPITSLSVSLIRSKERLQMIQTRLEKLIRSNEEQTRVRRFRWVLEERVIGQLRDEMRTARLELGGALAILPMASYIQSAQQAIEKETLNNQPPKLMDPTVPSNQIGFLTSEESGMRDAGIATSLGKPYSKPSFAGIDPTLNSSTEKSRIGRHELLVEHTTCSCVCHRRYTWNTPQCLINFLGAVLIAHSGFSILPEVCDDPYCQRPAQPFGTLSLHFPSWLLNRVAMCVLTFSPSPELILRLPRVIRAGSAVFNYAEAGDVAELQKLFYSGKASVWDVTSTRRENALNLAVTSNQLEVCKYLLAAGTDPYLQDLTHSSAFDNAWDRILACGLDQHDRNQLRAMFNDQERLENRHFSKLHKAVLGLIHVDLDHELSISSAAHINKRDSKGRTALSWAAVRGDLVRVHLLLKYGADLKIKSNRSYTCLHYAAQSGHLGVLTALLGAGAESQARNDMGHTPLHVAACYHDQVVVVKAILDIDGEVDPQDREGLTPLVYAIRHDRLETIKFLIEKGADPNRPNRLGWTPLVFAIVWNRHASLPHLLASPINCTTKDGDRSLLSHLMARFADLHTLQIMLPHCRGQFRLDQRTAYGQTAEEIAKRRNASAEWMHAFSEFFLTEAKSKTE